MSKLPLTFPARSLLICNILLRFYLSDAFPNLLKQLEISCDFTKVHILSYNNFPLSKVFLSFILQVRVPQQLKRKHILFTLVFIEYLA